MNTAARWAVTLHRNLRREVNKFVFFGVGAVQTSSQLSHAALRFDSLAPFNVAIEDATNRFEAGCKEDQQKDNALGSVP